MNKKIRITINDDILEEWRDEMRWELMKWVGVYVFHNPKAETY